MLKKDMTDTFVGLTGLFQFICVSDNVLPVVALVLNTIAVRCFVGKGLFVPPHPFRFATGYWTDQETVPSSGWTVFFLNGRHLDSS